MDKPPDIPGPLWSQDEIDQSNQGVPHPFAVRGIAAFNRGDYFTAHEDLEIAWREEAGPARDVYRGILQIGLAYYHILHGNYRGAIKMFQRYKPWLAPFPGMFRGIAIEPLREQAALAERQLLLLGAERMNEFNREFMKPVIYSEST